MGGELTVLQVSMPDGLSLDPLTLFVDGGCPAEVGVGRRHVAQALVITLVFAVLNEGLDLDLKIAGQDVGFGRMRFLTAWCQRSILT